MSNHLVKERRKVVKYEDYLKTLETGLAYKLYAIGLEKKLIDLKAMTEETLKEEFEKGKEEAHKKVEEKRK